MQLAGSADGTVAAAEDDGENDEDDDDVIWQSSAVDRHDVKANVIADCQRLSDQPTDLTLSHQSRPQETQQSAKSNSEISVARVLASLSVDPEPCQPHVPTTSGNLLTGKKASPIESRRSSTRRNTRNKRTCVDSRDTVAETDNDSELVELSTVKLSDVNGFHVPPVRSSCSGGASANNVSVCRTADSAVPLPNWLSQSHSMADLVMSVPADSSKHFFCKLPEQSSEVRITYDERSGQYKQTVRRSTNRRKSPGLPTIDDSASCRRTLPISVAINDSADVKESETANAATEVSAGNRRRRLSRRKENVVSAPGPSITNDASVSCLSPTDIVTRIGLRKSPSRNTEEPSKQLHASGIAENNHKARKTRRSSLPAGKLSKKSTIDSEPVSLASSSGTVGMRTDDKVEPGGPLMPGNASSGGAKKTSRKVRKSSEMEENSAARVRPARKRSGKVVTRTSPRKSDIASSSPAECSTTVSAELNGTKKRRGRQSAGKPQKASGKNEGGRKTKAAMKNTDNAISSSASKSSGWSGNSTSASVKRKRRSSPRKPSAETSRQPALNVGTPLPSIKCFLSASTENSEYKVNGELKTVLVDSCPSKDTIASASTPNGGYQMNGKSKTVLVDLCLSKDTIAMGDICSQEDNSASDLPSVSCVDLSVSEVNSCISTQSPSVMLTVSTTDCPVLKDPSSSATSTSPGIPSASSSAVQTDSEAAVQPSSSVLVSATVSSASRVTLSSVDNMDCATVSNVGHHEYANDVTSFSHTPSHKSVENHMSMLDSTPVVSG